MPILTEPLPPINPVTPVDYGIVEIGVKDGGSPNENLEIDANHAVRRFRCKWEHRFDAAKFFLGYAEEYDDSGTRKLTRILPQRHPVLDGLYATKMTGIKGFKWLDYPESPRTPTVDPLNVNEFKKAEFEIMYEHVPYDVVADADIVPDDPEFPGELQRFVEQPADIQPSGEYLQMPGATMKFITQTGTGPAHQKPVPVNSGKIIPQEVFHVVWHRLPYSVWTPDSNLFQRVYVGETDTHGLTVVPFFGCVNRAIFLGRPEGTVLLNNVIPRKRKSPLGVGYEWDLTWEFIYKPSGWNWLYFFNPGVPDTSGTPVGVGSGNDWYFVGTGSTHYFADTVPDNYSLYNARDLNKLFDVAASA